MENYQKVLFDQMGWVTRQINGVVHPVQLDIKTCQTCGYIGNPITNQSTNTWEEVCRNCLSIITEGSCC